MAALLPCGLEESSTNEQPMTSPDGERSRAAEAIERCLAMLRLRNPTDIQLADLADAVDAMRAGTYRVAVILAGAALSPRRAKPIAVRPARMARTFDEIEGEYRALRAADLR